MTTVIQERDLCRVRLRLLDLFKSFFGEEPDAEKLARWRGIFAALARAEISPAFDTEAGTIAGLLWEKSLSELQHEYCRVFTNLFAGRPVATTASFYRHDRNDGETLAGIREIMAEAGLVRDPSATAPADSLMVLLDILAALVEAEKNEDEPPARELSARLVAEFLVPLAENLTAALKASAHADFYMHCGRLLCSYLELEMELVDER